MSDLTSAEPSAQSRILVPHRELLREAVTRARRGHASAILVRGAPGSGKSRLLEGCLAELGDDDRALVLRGRCYRHGVHPYQALHRPMIDLGRWLAAQPQHEGRTLGVAALAPLAHMFPGFLRIAEVAAARPSVSPPIELKETYHLALAALRGLVTRVAAQRTLIVAIDDMQWGEADSGAVLAELLRPPDAPALMLVGCYRKGDEEPALVAALRARCRANAVDLDELELADATGTAAADPRATLTKLSASARTLAEIIAVAGRPIARGTAGRAARLGRADEREALTELDQHGLLDRHRAHDREAFRLHNAFADAILAGLSSAQVISRNRAVALEYQASGFDDPAMLSEHFAAAGETETASRAAARAAARANDRLGFAQAARLYRWSLELGALRGRRRSKIEIALANTLANGCDTDAAATAYLDAIPGLPADALPGSAGYLRSRAAEQYLCGGHLDEGLTTLREVIAGVDLRLPATGRAALATLAARRAQLRLRGYRFTERPVSDIELVDRRRLDTCWAAARSLVFVDNLRAAVFHMRHLGLALDAGDVGHIARGLAVEAGFLAIFSRSSRNRSSATLARAEELARAANDRVALAFVAMCSAVGPAYAGKWREARREWRRAASMLRDYGGGDLELVYARVWLQLPLFYLGEIAELARRVGAMRASGNNDGHSFAAMGMSTGHANFVWLARDDPRGARAAADRVAAAWTGNNHTVHYNLLAQIHIDLYRGDGDAAMERASTSWRPLAQSGLLRLQRVRVEARHLRARAALAVASRAADPSFHIKQAERDALRIERERMPWSTAIARLLRATISALHEDRDAALAWLRAAESSFEQADMTLYLAVARRRHGELLGGEEGARLIERADAFMRSEKIARPDLISQVLAPGFGRG